MAPPDYKNLDITLALVNLDSVTEVQTVEQVAVVISSLLLICHFMLSGILDIGVLKTSQFRLIWPTWWKRDVIRHA